MCQKPKAFILRILCQLTNKLELFQSVSIRSKNIGRIRQFITEDACKTLVSSPVSSRLEYWNILLWALPATTIQRYRSQPGSLQGRGSTTSSHQSWSLSIGFPTRIDANINFLCMCTRLCTRKPWSNYITRLYRQNNANT